jgi:hypothetical protein
MDENAPISSQILFPLISGIGIGMLFHSPYQVFLRTLEQHEVASGTSAFFLMRFTGATIGLVSFLYSQSFVGSRKGRLSRAPFSMLIMRNYPT